MNPREKQAALELRRQEDRAACSREGHVYEEEPREYPPGSEVVYRPSVCARCGEKPINPFRASNLATGALGNFLAKKIPV